MSQYWANIASCVLLTHSACAVRALLRNGASLESCILPSRIENSPIRCSIGSTALHISALIGNIAMAKVLLEAQVLPSGGGERGRCRQPHSVHLQMLSDQSWELPVLSPAGISCLAHPLLRRLCPPSNIFSSLLQEAVPGLELRGLSDASGLRPQDYAQRAQNPVLVHLLDERLPVALLRQIWINYSLEQALPPRHQTLGEGGGGGGWRVMRARAN